MTAYNKHLSYTTDNNDLLLFQFRDSC